MTCSTSETQPYTILFQKLADARSAQDEAEREDADRVMHESEEIKTVRELAEAASEQRRIETYTTA
jgi:hypothetical protein